MSPFRFRPDGNSALYTDKEGKRVKSPENSADIIHWLTLISNRSHNCFHLLRDLRSSHTCEGYVFDARHWPHSCSCPPSPHLFYDLEGSASVVIMHWSGRKKEKICSQTVNNTSIFPVSTLRNRTRTSISVAFKSNTYWESLKRLPRFANGDSCYVAFAVHQPHSHVND